MVIKKEQKAVKLNPRGVPSMGWRVIDTGCLDCYSNMAIDEALLQAYENGKSLPVLRFYGWKPGAFSVGYSQNPADELNLTRCKEAGIGFVRRFTGGGVIFHKDELTYSIVCSRKDLGLFTFSKETYKVLCSFIIKAYEDLGLCAEYSMQETGRRKKNWLCFAEREKYDILVNGRKLGGNAQRRRKDIVFQHGSIPLKPAIGRSLDLLNSYPVTDKTKIGSLNQALGRDISYISLKDTLIRSFKRVFRADIMPKGLSREEKALARVLLDKKYSRDEWNLYRDDCNAKARVA